MSESPGWVNVREDQYGHAIDADGNLIHDPRCYFCVNKDQRLIPYVKVEIEADHLAQVAGEGGSHA